MRSIQKSLLERENFIYCCLQGCFAIKAQTIVEFQNVASWAKRKGNIIINCYCGWTRAEAVSVSILIYFYSAAAGIKVAYFE